MTGDAVSTEVLDGVVRIAVRGELDYRSAGALKDAFERVEQRVAPPMVEIDLAGVTYLDASGLGLLVGMTKRQRSHDGDLRLVNVAPDAMAALEVTGLDRALQGEPEA